MAWDSSRRVPWRRVIKMYVMYAVAANIVLYLIDRKHYGVPTIIGIVLGGLFYTLLVVVMVKLGADPFRSFRRPPRPAAGTTARSTTRSSRQPAASVPGPRPRPAPTRRTASGPNHPRPKKK
jgi:hypothetical protein